MMLLIHVCHCDAALTGTHPDNGGNVHDILRLLMEELGDLVLQLEGSLIIIGTTMAYREMVLAELCPDSFKSYSYWICAEGLVFDFAFARFIQGYDRFRLISFPANPIAAEPSRSHHIFKGIDADQDPV